MVFFDKWNSVHETDMANPPSSNIDTGVRTIVVVILSITLASFILLWDSGQFPYAALGFAHWVGPYVFLPVLALILSMLANCLIQNLSCGEIQWSLQFQRALLTPLSLYGTWLLLYLLPGLRWVVEGLIQTSSKPIQTGLSSAFFIFWGSMYAQGLLNGLAQICPS